MVLLHGEIAKTGIVLADETLGTPPWFLSGAFDAEGCMVSYYEPEYEAPHPKRGKRMATLRQNMDRFC